MQDRLRYGEVTYEDWRLLASRVQSQVPEDVSRFKDALRIYSTTDRVLDYNFGKLRDLNRPVLKVNSLNNCPRAAQASTEDAGNLQATLFLSIGCRIMLLENLWTEHGLVNGAFGTVHEIVWQEGDGEARHRAPFALLVKFDKYTGPGFLHTENDDILVPVFMSTREFRLGNVSCTRTQFPVALGYAITVHKSQGLTVPMAVFNITARDFTPGLTYVAISRVKTLDGVLFEESFDLDRFRRRPSDFVRMRLADVERRRSQHVCRS
jgi:ATP-dependent DNA helicase PIF1